MFSVKEIAKTGHLDTFIGKQSATDVFPVIGRALADMETRVADHAVA